MPSWDRGVHSQARGAQTEITAACLYHVHWDRVGDKSLTYWAQYLHAGLGGLEAWVTMRWLDKRSAAFLPLQ